MPARFTATTNAFEKGVDSITPAAAIKLIDDWETSLKNLDAPGAKGIVRDLAALKKALDGDQPDAGKIKTLVAKLGDETVKIADPATEATKSKVEELGKALKAAA